MSNNNGKFEQEACNRLGTEADAVALLTESFDHDERPIVVSDDEAVRKIANVIDLIRERIGYRREAAYDLRQQALDEELAAERLRAALATAVGQIEVARVG